MEVFGPSDWFGNVFLQPEEQDTTRRRLEYKRKKSGKRKIKALLSEDDKDY